MKAIYGITLLFGGALALGAFAAPTADFSTSCPVPTLTWQSSSGGNYIMPYQVPWQNMASSVRGGNIYCTPSGTSAIASVGVEWNCEQGVCTLGTGMRFQQSAGCPSQPGTAALATGSLNSILSWRAVSSPLGALSGGGFRPAGRGTKAVYKCNVGVQLQPYLVAPVPAGFSCSGLSEGGIACTKNKPVSASAVSLVLGPALAGQSFTQGDGCPSTVSGDITVTLYQAGTYDYFYTFPDGSKSSKKSLSWSASSKGKSVRLERVSFQVSKADDYTVNVTFSGATSGDVTSQKFHLGCKELPPVSYTCPSAPVFVQTNGGWTITAPNWNTNGVLDWTAAEFVTLTSGVKANQPVNGALVGATIDTPTPSALSCKYNVGNPNLDYASRGVSWGPIYLWVPRPKGRPHCVASGGNSFTCSQLGS